MNPRLVCEVADTRIQIGLGKICLTPKCDHRFCAIHLVLSTQCVAQLHQIAHVLYLLLVRMMFQTRRSFLVETQMN